MCHLPPLLLEGLHSLLERHWIPFLVHVICAVLSQSRISRLPAWLLLLIGCVQNIGECVCAAAPLSVLLLLWIGALIAPDGSVLLPSLWYGCPFCWEELLLLAVMI